MMAGPPCPETDAPEAQVPPNAQAFPLSPTGRRWKQELVLPFY